MEVPNKRKTDGNFISKRSQNRTRVMWERTPSNKREYLSHRYYSTTESLDVQTVVIEWKSRFKINGLVMIFKVEHVERSEVSFI